MSDPPSRRRVAPPTYRIEARRLGPTVPRSVGTVVGFATQVVIGSIAFLVVFGAAVVVSLAVRFVEEHHIGPPWLAKSAGYVEMVIWGADLAVFALFILVEAYRFARDLLQGDSHG